MKEFSINISIPRFAEEQSLIKEKAQLLSSFLELCEKAPGSIIESDLQSFFDAYAQVEAIRHELSSSKWAHGREISKVADDILTASKAKFDELGICIQCAYDSENIEKLKGFEQIRAVF